MMTTSSDHGGCEVRTDECIARRVFVGIEVKLYEGVVKGVTDGVVGDSVLAGRSMNLHRLLS